MEWIKLKEKTPSEDMMCLVVKKNSRHITVLNWCNYYQSWDDFEGDDHECEKDDIEFYIPFDELPVIPIRN